MQGSDNVTGWVMAGVGTVIAALTSAVTYFYKTQVADYKKREADLITDVAILRKESEECKEDRELLRVNQAKLEARTEMLESKVNQLEVKQ